MYLSVTFCKAALMEFFLVGISAVLVPYLLKFANVDFSTYLGLDTSYVKTNQYNISLLPTAEGSTQYNITDSAPLVTYPVHPEISVDYRISKDRFWLAPTFGFEFLLTALQYTSQAENSTSSTGTIDQVYYRKSPYFGLKLGYSLINGHKNNLNRTFGLDPYVIVTSYRVSYDDIGSYQGQQINQFVVNYGGGLSLSFKGNISVFAQYTYSKFDTRGSTLSHQVKIGEGDFRLGMQYRIDSKKNKEIYESTDNYDKIIDDLDVNNYEEEDIKVNKASAEKTQEIKSQSSSLKK